MGRFMELAEVDDQRVRSELLPSVVAGSRMSMWTPGESFPTSGPRILLGVATWSLYDLDLLDALESKSFGADTVHLFDMDSCKTMSDFEKYIPGIGKVFQTPVVGYWQDGELVHREQGAAARDWIRNRYALFQI